MFWLFRAKYAAVLCAVGLLASECAVGDESTSPDVLCGPRCIARVLDHFGIETTVVDIVRALGPDVVKNGMSASNIQAFLARNDIHCRVVELSNRVQVTWPHPVIAHLRPGEDNGAIGHFIVIEQSDADNDLVLIFNGLSGTESGRYSLLQKRMSGVCLLTSPTPIESTVRAVERRKMSVLDRLSEFNAIPWIFLAIVLLSGRIFPNWRWQFRSSIKPEGR